MSRRLGYAAVAGAALLWAVGGTVARTMTDRGVDVVELVASRAWIALAGLALVVGLRRGSLPPRERARGLVAATIVFGLALASANFTYYFALSRLPVAIAIVVQYTAPALVVLWGIAVERRAPSARVSGAIALALVGVALLSDVHEVVGGAGLTLDPIGLVAAGASSFAFAAYMLSGEVVGGALGTERGMLGGFAVASVFWLAVVASRGLPRTLAIDARGVVFLGVFGTLVPFLLFLWGLARVQAARASIVSTLEPLSAAVLAWALLGQSLAPAQVVGAALVVAGIASVQGVPAEVPPPD